MSESHNTTDTQVEHQICETVGRHWLSGAREKRTTVYKGPAATAASASTWPSSITSGPSVYSSFSPCFAEKTRREDCVEETPLPAPQHSLLAGDVPKFLLQRDLAGAQVGEQAVDVVRIALEKRAGRNRVGVALRHCGGMNGEYTAARPCSCLRLLTCL